MTVIITFFFILSKINSFWGVISKINRILLDIDGRDVNTTFF